MINESFKEYQIFHNSLVGQGNFGIVLDCKHKTKYQDLSLCVKILNAQTFIDERVAREMEILEKLKDFQNNHIINIFDIYEVEGKIHIFMEKCNGGDLKIQLDKRKQFNNYYTTTEILDFIYQFVDGYQLLIQNNIIHRDIKPQNIFVDKNTYKIGDLGAGRILENVKVKGLYTNIGSPIYSSPQILMQEPFSYKTDIYSFGMVLYQLCYLTFPLEQSLTGLNKFINWLRQNKFKVVDLPNKGSQEEINEITNIIEQTLVFEEEQRLDWQDLISNIKNNQIYDKFKQKDQKPKLMQIPIQKAEENIIQTQHFHQSIIKQTPQQNKVIKFDSMMKKSPLSQFIRLQEAKLQLIEYFYQFFNQSLQIKEALIKIRDIDFQHIVSSIFGYQYSIIEQIKAIHTGNMDKVSLHIKNQQQIFEQNKICVQEFQKLKQQNDESIFEEIRTTEKRLIEEKNMNQFILQTIQAINNQKIRLQESVRLRNLLEQKTIDCEQFSQLLTYFVKIYLEQKIKDVLISNEVQQIPKEVCKLIVYYYEILDLEKIYTQTEFYKEVKIQRFPKLEWIEEDIQSKLALLKKNIAQNNQNQQQIR